MNSWSSVTLVCAVLSVGADIGAAQTPPVPDNPPLAQTSLGFNPKTRCPDLRIADEGTLAVVVFWVPRSGIPSQISIKASSGLDALDAAAVSCVSKHRVAPAPRHVDSEPFDSWQQIAWRWAARGNSDSGAVTPSASVTTSATVHVCVDETGKLKQNPTIVHSSGNAGLDEAAVQIAAAGSAHYRPRSSLDGVLSGCAQLSIKFETN